MNSDSDDPMAMKFWILEDGQIKEATLLEWAAWMNNPDLRIVDKTIVGDATVSTIFLGVDHGFGSGMALVFETMIFGGDENEFQERSSTLGEAKRIHYEAVDRLRAAAAAKCN